MLWHHIKWCGDSDLWFQTKPFTDSGLPYTTVLQLGMSCYIFLCRWSCYMLWRHNAQLTIRGTRTFWAYVLMFANTDKVRCGVLPQWLYILTRILLTFLHLAPNTKTYQHSCHASQVGKVQSIIFQSNWYVVDTLNLLTVICVSLF